MTGARLTLLCGECGLRTGEAARYLADLGNGAPAWGDRFPLCEGCAGELRAEGMVVSIRTYRPPA